MQSIVIVFYFIAVVFFIIGYLIRFQKMYNLMAGYKASSKKGNITDPEGLAREIFWLCMVLGVLFFIVPFFIHIPHAPPIIFGIAIFYSIIAVFRANMKYDRRFQKPPRQ
ncbi:DUF3784 domain-containing protein [Desulfitibacter alkalitolerans]|uniref:DUF3784 domain-containing protein n=1 Tax=Desulfitibacter alkalitolerans TaxID=264641 RepID=UPI0004832BC9|nr:DUF3784 domain-containing protein [Desulfitibacter alkalitolerans]